MAVLIDNYAAIYRPDTRIDYFIGSVQAYILPVTTTIPAGSQSAPSSQPPTFSYAGLTALINAILEFFRSL